MEETVGPVSTCRTELLRWWRQPTGLMVSFTIFTASVWKILDRPMYMCKHFTLSLTYVKDSWKLCLHEPVFDQSSPQPVVPHPTLLLSSTPMSVEKGLISEQDQSAPENSTHHQKRHKPACYERTSEQNFIAETFIYIYISTHTQGVPGRMCQTSGGCSLC
jgi:hypothetical protein